MTDVTGTQSLFSAQRAIRDAIWESGESGFEGLPHDRADTIIRWFAERELRLTAEIVRQQELWSLQSRVITALAAEVPDDVRARVLAPIRETARG